jgi:hypothetical protein
MGGTNFGLPVPCDLGAFSDLRHAEDRGQQLPIGRAADGDIEDAAQYRHKGRMQRGMPAYHRAYYDIGAGLALAPGCLVPGIDRADLRLDLVLAPFKMTPTAATADTPPDRENAGT